MFFFRARPGWRADHGRMGEGAIGGGGIGAGAEAGGWGCGAGAGAAVLPRTQVGVAARTQAVATVEQPGFSPPTQIWQESVHSRQSGCDLPHASIEAWPGGTGVLVAAISSRGLGIGGSFASSARMGAATGKAMARARASRFIHDVARKSVTFPLPRRPRAVASHSAARRERRCGACARP